MTTTPTHHINACIKETISSLGSDSETTRQSSTAPTLSKATCKKRTIDETLLPPDEAKKLELRRAYNRDCASRARKRAKSRIASLQSEVCALQQDRGELRKELSVVRKQLELVERQYRTELLRNTLLNQQQRANALADFPALSRSAGLGAFGGLNHRF